MPLHRVWEYRDIGRLFITVGGRESDNRGVEVGLVEVILRVSLEVILHHLLRQLGSHSPGEGAVRGCVRSCLSRGGGPSEAVSGAVLSRTCLYDTNWR